MSDASSVENARMLAHVLGVEVHSAEALLAKRVLVTAGCSDSWFAKEIVALLERTVHCVDQSLGGAEPAVELVVGAAAPQARSERVHVSLGAESVRISSESLEGPLVDASVHPVVALIAACYAAGAVVRRLVGRDFPYAAHDPLTFAPSDLLGLDPDALRVRVDIGDVHLAGAGAVGNAFVAALGRFEVVGELRVVDPDVVEGGNLNRTVLFKQDDVGKPKAGALVERAQTLLPGLRLGAHAVRLQSLANRSAWLQQLVCAVDSRRARRALQEELPHTVYDASTSGIAEVVLHFNSVETLGRRACLSCVYHEDQREDLHEEHVAQMLGVHRNDVRGLHLSEAAAEKVLRKHPHLLGRDLVGLACDSLFKELCGAGLLGIDSGQQVLAPLAFVSVLAGALLALEFVRRHADPSRAAAFNEWHVSPWCAPQLALQRSRPSRSGCKVCGQPAVTQVISELWGVHDPFGPGAQD